MDHISIIFVDDEPNVLSGLRRMLHAQRKHWDMHFLQEPREALQLISGKFFDVVVADMRMPDMSGADFLREVSSISPSSVRVILSGYWDKKMVMQTVPVAHQFMAKPTSSETISEVVKRSFALRRLLQNEVLSTLVSRMGALPALPETYVQLVDKLESGKANPGEVGEIISRDVGMSAKILQLVNSAFFGLVRKVESIQQAVVYLGMDTIQALVLGVHIFEKMQTLKIDGLSMQARVRHSLQVAELANKLGSLENIDKEIKETAFFAGVLHDCGMLLLVQNMPEKYEEVINKAKEEDISLDSAETDVFGVSHAEIGAYLLNIWGLPSELVNAVAFHHRPLEACKAYMDPLALVHIADYLEFKQNRGSLVGALLPPEEQFLEAIGKEGTLHWWEQNLLQENTDG